jgi:hypothetical protein
MMRLLYAPFVAVLRYGGIAGNVLRHNLSAGRDALNGKCIATSVLRIVFGIHRHNFTNPHANQFAALYRSGVGCGGFVVDLLSTERQRLRVCPDERK